MLAFPKTERIHDPAHLRRIRTLACCVPGCRRWPVQAHHLGIAQPKGRGLKSGDQWTVPLCFSHHDPRSRTSVHAAGDERAWWRLWGIDPMAIAAQCWAETQQGEMP